MWTGDRLGPTWENDGQCLDKPVSMFFLSEIGDPDVAHISEKDPQRVSKLKKHNIKKMVRAVEICRDCPVWVECLEQATDLDRALGVRGGDIPIGYAPKPPKPRRYRKKGLNPNSLKNLRTGSRDPDVVWAENQSRRREKMKSPCEKCGGMDWHIRDEGVRGKESLRCRACERLQYQKHYALNGRKKKTAKLDS